MPNRYLRSITSPHAGVCFGVDMVQIQLPLRQLARANSRTGAGFGGVARKGARGRKGRLALLRNLLAASENHFVSLQGSGEAAIGCARHRFFLFFFFDLSYSFS